MLRLGPRRFGLGLVALAVSGHAGCSDPVVTGVGQFGEPIERITDDNGTPRLLVAASTQACGDEAAPTVCTTVCEGPPHACTAADACVPVLLDSGSPFSLFSGPELSAGRECLEVRRGTPQFLEESVVRFRFEGAPVVRVPESFDVGGWDWMTGATETDTASVGAVIGANILRHFAVRMSPTPSTVTFYEQFPGSEQSLADLGWVFARLAYPNRLIGARSDDACVIGDLDCNLVPIIDNSREIGFEPTRMVVDACVAPPPCTPDWKDEAGRRTCDLRRGDEGTGCRDADDPELGGRGASFVVSTGAPDTIIFADSLERMFGGDGEVPTCADRLTSTHRYCTTALTSTLTVPGYAPMTDVPMIRVRALALVDGNTQPAGAGPCTRLRRRLSAARLSCQALDERNKPWRSLDTTEIEPDTHAVVMGETRWGSDKQSDADLWLEVHVVSETSALARNLRREVGSDAVEPDGILGATLLEHSELVLDYTEEDESPGLRVGCLSGAPVCLALPACTGADEPNQEGPGRASCCQGMPTDLILAALASGAAEAEACCAAFDRETLAVVQSAGICLEAVKR